jgi:YgiT-type zinc finger domain-containing protein
MKPLLNIKMCPTCGSDKVKHMQKDWVGKYKETAYTVPSLNYFECTNCGEKIYDKEAMLRIEEKSPALEFKRKKRKAA